MLKQKIQSQSLVHIMLDLLTYQRTLKASVYNKPPSALSELKELKVQFKKQDSELYSQLESQGFVKEGDNYDPIEYFDILKSERELQKQQRRALNNWVQKYWNER